MHASMRTDDIVYLLLDTSTSVSATARSKWIS